MTAAATPSLRDDNIRLGILYMMGAVFLFSIQNAIGTLTVRDLCRTDHSASIVTWTAIFMTLLALPALPLFWVTPDLMG